MGHFGQSPDLMEGVMLEDWSGEHRQLPARPHTALGHCMPDRQAAPAACAELHILRWRIHAADTQRLPRHLVHWPPLHVPRALSAGRQGTWTPSASASANELSCKQALCLQGASQLLLLCVHPFRVRRPLTGLQPQGAKPWMPSAAFCLQATHSRCMCAPAACHGPRQAPNPPNSLPGGAGDAKGCGAAAHPPRSRAFVG